MKISLLLQDHSLTLDNYASWFPWLPTPNNNAQYFEYPYRTDSEFVKKSKESRINIT